MRKVFAMAILAILFSGCVPEPPPPDSLFQVGEFSVKKNQSVTIEVPAGSWDTESTAGSQPEPGAVMVYYQDNKLFFKIKDFLPEGIDAIYYVPTYGSRFQLGPGKKEIWVSRGKKIISHHILIIEPPHEQTKW